MELVPIHQIYSPNNDSAAADPFPFGGDASFEIVPGPLDRRVRDDYAPSGC